jgi:hypothetical protein
MLYAAFLSSVFVLIVCSAAKCRIGSTLCRITREHASALCGITHNLDYALCSTAHNQNILANSNEIRKYLGH